MVAVRRSVLCALVLALLTLAAVRATTPKARSAVQRLAPDDLGTTWTYRDTTDGQPTGQSVYQVTGHAILGSGDIASVLHEHFDDFLGSGELVDASDYRGFVGGTVVDFGLRSAPGYTAYSPPIPTVPRTLGKFTYDGKQTGPTGTVHVDGDVLGVETVAVAGRTFTGCEHIRTTSTTKEGSQPASTQVTDAWDCPDVGTVKDVLVLSGKSLEEDLVARTGPGPQFGLAQSSRPSTTSAPTRRVDLGALAWSDTLRGPVDFAPTTAGGLVVSQVDDGTITALDTHTGAVRWRLQLPGPPVAPIALSGDSVVVADSARRLWALDAQTGLARWSVGFGDVVSTAAVVAGDVVLVSTEDRIVHALDVSTGHSRWETTRPARVTQPIAIAGATAVVGDDAGGVEGRDIGSGALKWTARLQASRMAGPVTAGGLVVATDSRGYVETFDAGSGAARWSRQFSESTSVTPAVSSDTVAVAIGGQVKLLDARTGHPRATIHARAASPPVIAGDTVVVAARDSLASYRLADGALVASAHLPARSSVSLALAMSDDSLVVSTTVEPPWPTTAELAFPLAGGPKGGVRFTGDVTPVPAPPQWPPVDAEGALAFVGGNGVVYRGDRPLLPAGTTIPPFIVSDGPTLYTEHGTDLVAIDAVTGAQRWKFPLGPALPASVPAVDGPNLVVPIAGVGLAALDRSTGKPVWFQTITDTQGVSSPLVLPGGDVVYAVGGIQRFDGTTGTPRWTVPNLDTVSPPGYFGSTVFAVAGPPDGSASLYAIDADTGTVRWQRPARIQLLIGPVAAGDVVLVPNGQSLLALDAATGTPRWSVAVPTGLAGAPAVLGNRVFVDETGSEENAGLHDHRVSAWDLSTGQFLGAFEPTGSGFGHDAFTLSGDRLLVSATSDRGASIFSLAPAGAP